MKNGPLPSAEHVSLKNQLADKELADKRFRWQRFRWRDDSL